MVLSYQTKNIEKIRESIKKNNRLAIIGAKNSGRKYVIEHWSNDTKKPVIINLRKTENDVKYSSLIQALSSDCCSDLINKLFKPSFSFWGFSINIEDSVLIKDKKDIQKVLTRLAIKNTIIFIIDDGVDLSSDSIALVEDFINKKSKHHDMYEFILSEDKIDNIFCVYFENLSDSNYDKLEILRNLNLNSKIILSEKVQDFIFSNCKNNIKLLIKIIEGFNNNKLDNELNNFDSDNITKEIFNYTTIDYQYTEKLKELLTMCAIADYCFKSNDFAFLLKDNESIIKLLLDFAKEHYYIEGTAAGYQIVFGIVRKLFKNIDDIQKKRVYINIFDMYCNLYPSDYYNKFIYSGLAANERNTVFLMQHLFKIIRLNQTININDYCNILSNEEYKVLSCYNLAFGLISQKKYTECIELLERLNNLHGVLLYEINVLISQCLIKSIDEIDRNNALSLLKYNENDNILDDHLKYRIDIRKIAALIHIGKYAEAAELCGDLVNRILNMLEQTKSIEYEYYLNVIYRKYSYIHEYRISIDFVNKSVNFFRLHKKDYYKGYYIALNNLFSLYIMDMQIENAKNIKKEIQDLKLEKNNINFPRPEIFENNTYLFNYFSKSKNLIETIEDFKKLYEGMNETADHIFIASNYAVFLMLNNNLNAAYEIINNEIKHIEADGEGVYSFRLLINLAICEFLMDNQKKSFSISELKKINYNKADPHYRVRNEELQGILKLMNSTEKCNNAEEWCSAYKSNVNNIMSTYTTYQQGLVFTTLFDWDDD